MPEVRIRQEAWHLQPPWHSMMCLVHSVKQIIGRQFDDRVVSEVLQRKSWALCVVKGPG